MKRVRVIFSPEAEEVYNYLNENAEESKTESMILKALHKKIRLIKSNTLFFPSTSHLMKSGESQSLSVLKKQTLKRSSLPRLLMNSLSAETAFSKGSPFIEPDLSTMKMIFLGFASGVESGGSMITEK